MLLEAIVCCPGQTGCENKEVFDIPLNYFESYNENEKMNIFENNCIDFYGLKVKRSNF